MSTTICSRPLFVVLSYRWTTTKVLHICRTKDVIWLWVQLFVVDHYLSYLVTAGLQQKYYIFVVQKMYLTFRFRKCINFWNCMVDSFLARFSHPLAFWGEKLNSFWSEMLFSQQLSVKFTASSILNRTDKQNIGNSVTFSA